MPETLIDGSTWWASIRRWETLFAKIEINFFHLFAARIMRIYSRKTSPSTRSHKVYSVFSDTISGGRQSHWCNEFREYDICVRLNLGNIIFHSHAIESRMNYESCNCVRCALMLEYYQRVHTLFALAVGRRHGPQLIRNYH